MNISKNIVQVALTIVAITLSIYLSYYPLFHGDAWWGHDAIVHLNRVYGTLKNLSQGQFPPYFDVDYDNYPGYSWNLFYPPLYNIIASSIQYFFEDYNITTKLVSMMIGVIALRCAFALFYLQDNSFYRSLLLALCYACSLYMVDNIFIRFALPESFALAFFPLLVAGLLASDKKKSLKYLIIANTFILLSNIPAAISVMWFVILYFAFHFDQIDKIKVFIKSYVIALLLSAWFILPLIYVSYESSFYMMNSNFFGQISVFTVDLYNFISGDFIKLDPLKNMILGLGYPLFIVFIFCLWKKKNGFDKNNLIILMLIFFITTSVNYSFLPDVFSIFSKIQFSWRLIPFVVILMLLEISNNKQITSHIIVLILLMTALISTSITITAYQSLPTKKDLNTSVVLFEKIRKFDYALTDAIQKQKQISAKQLFCQAGKAQIKINYSKSIESNGLPSYVFNLPQKASCTIPFIAYKPLYLEGVENYQYAGFFQVNLPKGQHKITVKIKFVFQCMLYATLLLALLILYLLNKKYILKRR